MRRRMATIGTFVPVALIGPLSGTAFAQELTVESVAVSVDTLWIVIAGILVFLMQAGFALVEAGFTRAKNTANIVMKNFMDFSVGSLVYWAVGFALAYGGTSVGGFLAYGGLGDSFFLSDRAQSSTWFFQVVFAGTAATIVSGAMAERTKFSAYLIYTPFITGLIYPVVTHWAWSGAGWLTDIGFIDFAGSGLVHLVGGVAALAGVAVIGPRIGKYDDEGQPLPIPGHSLMLGALGVFVLWFGWYGFNGGSTLAAVGADFSSVMVTTTLAAAAGSLAAMVAAWVFPVFGRPDPGMTLNGALAGLVGITAGTANVSNFGSVAIGAVAGVIVVFSIVAIDRRQIDDPVGAISVHGVCGLWGLIAVGLFESVNGEGLLYGGGLRLLGVQIVGGLAIVAWVGLTSSVVFRLIHRTFGLRVSAEEELAGLDRIEHGTSAYPEFTEQIADPRILDPVS
ncbi:MAG: ammonium transporter [Acidimicrobiia bacterium]|nr:ammonium transporter [Acidimicrobiia bacterium]